MKRTKILIVLTTLLMLELITGSGSKLFAQAGNFPQINAGIAAPHKKKPSSKFQLTERRVQYIGRTTNTLSFSDNSLQLVQDYVASSVQMQRSAGEASYADSGLVVSIDTTQLIGLNESTAGATQGYDGYPVVIKNTSAQPLVVGNGVTVPVIIEALDKANNWRTVEGHKEYNRNAATGKIVLQPGDIVALAIPVYSGSFKTLLRVRVFDNYSEPFTGYLNPGQLTEPVK